MVEDRNNVSIAQGLILIVITAVIRQPFDTISIDLTVPGGMGGREVIEKMSGFLTKPIVLASIALDTVYQVWIFNPTEKYKGRRHHAIKRRTQISSLSGDRP